MSEYQYYEFCSIYAPLSALVREKMAALSSRARVGTHGASYVYHYADFRGDVKALCRDYFDIFFYISNWGTVELAFKYPNAQIDRTALEGYALADVITCQAQEKVFLLDVKLCNENGYDWLEGEGILPTLLPLYDEIKRKRYDFLDLVHGINDVLCGKGRMTLTAMKNKSVLSSAQRAFLDLFDQ